MVKLKLHKFEVNETETWGKQSNLWALAENENAERVFGFVDRAVERMNEIDRQSAEVCVLYVYICVISTHINKIINGTPACYKSHIILYVVLSSLFFPLYHWFDSIPMRILANKHSEKSLLFLMIFVFYIAKGCFSIYLSQYLVMCKAFSLCFAFFFFLLLSQTETKHKSYLGKIEFITKLFRNRLHLLTLDTLMHLDFILEARKFFFLLLCFISCSLHFRFRASLSTPSICVYKFCIRI